MCALSHERQLGLFHRTNFIWYVRRSKSGEGYYTQTNLAEDFFWSNFNWFCSSLQQFEKRGRAQLDIESWGSRWKEMHLFFEERKINKNLPLDLFEITKT